MFFIKLLALLAALAGWLNFSLPTERVLDISWHHQQHNLSCEAAALRMALPYYGINAGETALISYMSFDRRPALFDHAGRLITWGDPSAAYVGNPDGHIQLYTGYGAYNEPVARAAELAGASVSASGTVSPSDLYDAVLRGHPAVAWISNTYRQVRLWTYVAYDGKTVRYTLTEHAVTIAGVRPDAVLIDDPWFGRAWHPKAQFESAYRTFSDMAVVLGPPPPIA